ncbi:hypothetical protein [Nocardiopsis kunsanensis]|uniref:Uncharacterized protein n=1 Tax=Nocardiopsis kunsanensis TaxID=141693 RepID=A0A918X8G8_9ACTN|nr:hypothetical protein [Nocardiopsis kunsanensis]GHD18118.1 hypothetical protein GCM10007147_07750 [Nocardiopsis kunsanensis]
MKEGILKGYALNQWSIPIGVAHGLHTDPERLRPATVTEGAE